MPSSSEATWHYELFAMLLLGSDCSEQKISLPAVSTGSRLQANLRRPLLLSCECRSTCSVLSETICQKHLETAISPISAGTQSILNTYGSKWTHTTTSQIYTNLNSDNKQQRQIHTCTKQENPSTISLCEALMEICRLQVEPLGTTNFLPRARWDLRTARETQLFQLCPLAQGFKQICGALCSFRVSVEAPAVFCQKQSVKNTLRQQ